MRISDWSSDVCSSDLGVDAGHLTFRSLRKAVAAAVSDMAGVEVARDLLGHISTNITEGTYAKRPDLLVVIADRKTVVWVTSMPASITLRSRPLITNTTKIEHQNKNSQKYIKTT